MKSLSLFVFDGIAGAQIGGENGEIFWGNDCLMIPTVSRITLDILKAEIFKHY